MCPCGAGGLDGEGAAEAGMGAGPPGLAGPEPGLGLALPWVWWEAKAPPRPERGLLLSDGETLGWFAEADGNGVRGEEEDGGVER